MDFYVSLGFHGVLSHLQAIIVWLSKVYDIELFFGFVQVPPDGWDLVLWVDYRGLNGATGSGNRGENFLLDLIVTVAVRFYVGLRKWCAVTQSHTRLNNPF